MGIVMQVDIMQIIPWGLTVLGLVSAAIVRDRYVMDKIAQKSHETREHADTRVDALHARINDIKDDYVRRDDLAGHLERIDDTLKGLREEQRKNNETVLLALATRPIRPGQT